MKVFVSWSGERSKAVAEYMSHWLKCVIQSCEPWISTKEVDKGSILFNEIQESLNEVSVGIICLTKENKLKPWLLFEAGALAKGLEKSRVCTFLIDLEPEDVEDPLSQFMHTRPRKTEMLSLLQTINGSLKSNKLSSSVLESAFNTYWPQFEIEFKEMLEKYPSISNVPERTEHDILSEVLKNTRGINHRINKLESKYASLQNSALLEKLESQNRINSNEVYSRSLESYFGLLHDEDKFHDAILKASRKKDSDSD